MNTGLGKLKSGDFNDMSQDWQSDGSVIIKLSKREEEQVHRFRVRNLYQPDEEEVDLETGKPLKNRQQKKRRING